MSKFDRFTKALAMANFHEAFKVLVSDESTIASKSDCFPNTCHSFGCPRGCFCDIFAALCFPL